MNRDRARHGFTLIEMLLAITILASLAGVMAVWLGRESILLSRRLERGTDSVQQRWIGVLRDDVFAATTVELIDEHTLVLRTCHSVPGEQDAGWKEVRWSASRERTSALTRSAGRTTRSTPLVNGLFRHETAEPDTTLGLGILWLDLGTESHAIGIVELGGER